MKKVMITGGSGFVGNAVIKALLKEPGTQIYALGRTTMASEGAFYFSECDLMDYHGVNLTINKIRPDYLIHLAWNVEHSSYLNSGENLLWVGASLNLLKSFAESGGKRVFLCGTCFERVEPLSLYAASKLHLYRMAEKYCESAAISLAWGRLFFLFGEGEQITRVVPYALTQLMKGNKAICKNSAAIRDFMYVEDAGNAIAKAMFSDVEGVFDIATGNQITMGELFNVIGEICGNPSGVILENQPVVPQDIVGDATKLKELVGLEACTDLKTALKRTLSYWKG